MRKTPPANAECFLMTLFQLNQTGKKVFTKNCLVIFSRALSSHYIFIKALRNQGRRTSFYGGGETE